LKLKTAGQEGEGEGEGEGEWKVDDSWIVDEKMEVEFLCVVN
jgi:hypothetical protein